MSEFNPPKIMIGMPVGSGSIPWPTAVSLLNTIRACDKEKIPVRLESVVGCSVVTWARSAILDSFLKSDCTHLFWIDSDVVWSLDDFFRLVGFGSALDVVCAAYPFKKDPPTYLINFPVKGEYEMNGLGCVKIKSTGMGFSIMKRHVVEKVAEGKPRRKDPLLGVEIVDVFRIDHEGEDVAFFTDIRAAGFDIWLDATIQIGHIGSRIYRGNLMDALGLSEVK